MDSHHDWLKVIHKSLTSLQWRKNLRKEFQNGVLFYMLHISTLFWYLKHFKLDLQCMSIMFFYLNNSTCKIENQKKGHVWL